MKNNFENSTPSSYSSAPYLINQNLSIQIYKILRQKIVKGDFYPGMRIQDENLTKEFGVSRTPIRDALYLLEKNGLIKIIPRKGAFIIRLTRQEIVDTFDLREGLEGISAYLAAQRVSIENLNRVKETVEKRLENIKSLEMDPYYPPDIDFHKTIAESSGNSKLMEHLTSIYDQILTLRMSSASQKGRAKAAAEEHMEIYEMLRQRNPEGAEKYMRIHIRNAKENILLHYSF